MSRRSLAEKKQEFQILFDRHAPRLRAMLARRCASNPHVEVDDVLQEVSIRLWRALCDEREITNPASYLTRVAMTTLIDGVRRAGTRSAEIADTDTGEQVESETAMPDQLASAEQLAGEIDVCIGSMAANRRRALGLYLQGMNTLEIGRVCGWSEAKARNLAYRALADLKQEINGNDHDG